MTRRALFGMLVAAGAASLGVKTGGARPAGAVQIPEKAPKKVRYIDRNALYQQVFS